MLEKNPFRQYCKEKSFSCQKQRNGTFMNIIAGIARGVELSVPETMQVRPTSGRARKALFDSLGDFSGLHILDLFAGSGALALESASRGAAAITMLEISPVHIAVIKENLRRVTAAGVTVNSQIVDNDATLPEHYLAKLKHKPDIIFADPPYLQSSEFFQKLTGNEYFCKTLSGSLLIWEIPDTPGAAGVFLAAGGFAEKKLRRFGSTMFFCGRLQ